MKSPRDHMEIVNAYKLVGSYRGAPELCGTTHKTVKDCLRFVVRRPVPPIIKLGGSQSQARQTGRVGRGKQVRLANVATDHVGRTVAGLGHDVAFGGAT